MKYFAFFVFIVFLSGCATGPDLAMQDQQTQNAQLLEQIKQKKADLDARQAEAEEAYKNGKINEAEYLSLKNQLKQELDNYAAYVNQKSYEIEYETVHKLRAEHGY